MSTARHRRRQFCQQASLSTLGLLAGRALADQAPLDSSRKFHEQPALIVLWMRGGPSQFETFDPHPGVKIGGPTQALATSLPDVQFADGLPRLAEQAHSLAIVRSVVSKEGDHERGVYTLKTGFRPNPTVVHPSLGAICSAELSADGVEIPRYVSIHSSDPNSRGGLLGEQHNPYRIYDPKHGVPDVKEHVNEQASQRRQAGLAVIEQTLRRANPELALRTMHEEQYRRARQMMSSTQLEAFDISKESASLREKYGDSAFGRGCLAACRLLEVGVKCVEVELSGWDTHADNFNGCQTQNRQLDPAFAALIQDLQERERWANTVIMCAGEFGRTPKINPLDGRDHWPTGFSVVLAGGRIRTGQVIGQTDPEGGKDPVDPVSVENLFATVLTALGIKPSKEHITRAGRPTKYSDGEALDRLLAQAPA